MVLAPTANAQTGPPAPADEDRQRGRLLTQQILEGDDDALLADAAPPLFLMFGGPDGVRGYLGSIRERLGGAAATRAAAAADETILNERVYRSAGHAYYCQVRRVPGTDVRAVTRLRWGGGPDDRSVSVAFVSAVPDSLLPRRTGYETRTALSLPFREGQEAYVAWGGRHGCDNYHVSLGYGNAYAYDIVVQQEGRPYARDGARNEDHYCYGVDVVAPAPGRVVAVVDTVAENPRPGEFAGGGMPNYVVIDHENGEFSNLVHVREGSVPVAVGDRVGRGDKVGECGNNGQSRAPHIHYQLQDSPELSRETEGLPAPFVDYYTREGYVERGEPRRGDYVRRE